MALNTKYKGSFDVLEGFQRSLSTYDIYFKVEGYSGAIISIGLGDGIRAKIQNSKDSIVGLHEKKLEITVLDNADISELQTAAPKTWKVEVKKTVGTTTTTDFEGWLIPTSSSTDYVDGVKSVRLEATDGLNYLKNIDFVDDSNFYYDGLYSVYEIIRLSLAKTGLALKVNTINNTFAVGNDTSFTAEALKQRFLDMDLFRGDNEPLDTYKVLSDIIITEKCRLYQEDGEWWIENISEKLTGYVNSRKHDTDGSQLSGGTIDLRISAVYNSNYHPLGGGGISNLMPIKWAKVQHKLGGFKNKLLNRDFNNFSSGNFSSWIKSNTSISLSRDGDGTSGNLYGPKIGGFSNKNKESLYIYQEIELANSSNQNLVKQILNSNVIFKGTAFTQGLKMGLVQCLLFIDVDTFSDRNGTYPPSTTVYGLSDSGGWIVKKPSENYANFIELENIDINNYPKKTPKSWDITSKKISDNPVRPNPFATVWTNWQNSVLSIRLQVRLCQGVSELSVFPGEVQESYVKYKNISLGWVNADTNLNLKEIHYKAAQLDYAPNDETFPAIYGDYVDASNLSAIKDINGNLTTYWTSENSNVQKNFHSHGATQILKELGTTQRVYDGTIKGLLKYRHSVYLAGFSNRGFIVGYTFDYKNTDVDVRIIEHQTVNSTVKKTGVLSDGTEINMTDTAAPSPIMGNGVGGSSGGGVFNIDSWIQQVISGVTTTTPNDEDLSIIWSGYQTNDTFDFGSIVKRDNVLAIGQNDVDFIDFFKNGNRFYDNSFTYDDGTVLPRLGLNSSELFVEGDFHTYGKYLVNNGLLTLTTETYSVEDNILAGVVSAENERLLLRGAKGIEAQNDFYVGKSYLSNEDIYSGGVFTSSRLRANTDEFQIPGNLNFDTNSKLKINGSFGGDHTFLKSVGDRMEWKDMTVGEITDINDNYVDRLTAQDIDGVKTFNDDVILGGRLKVAGSFGADHYFLKSNGTTQEWAIMNVGEIADIDQNFVRIIVDEGERGFSLYSDYDKNIREAFFFTNPDTGIVGMHGFRLNGSTVEQYGFQMLKDGKPYWLYPDASRKRILTESDLIGLGSNSNPGTLKFGPADKLLFGSISNLSPTVFMARIQNGLNMTDIIGGVLGNFSGIAIESTFALLLAGDAVALRFNTLYIKDKEIDFSGFATGKVLKATSSTKAEWVTP